MVLHPGLGDVSVVGKAPGRHVVAGKVMDGKRDGGTKCL